LSKFHDISDRYKKRSYELEHCAGCGVEIEDEYVEVVIPDAYDDEKVKHIALCNSCAIIAEQHGAFD